MLLSLTVFPKFLCWFLAFTRLLFTLKYGWALPLMLLFGHKSDTGSVWRMEREVVLGIFRFYFIFISYSVTLQRWTSFLISKRNPSDELCSLRGEEFCQNQDERCLSAGALMYWEVCFLDATSRCVFQPWLLHVEEFSCFFQKAVWENLHLEQVCAAREVRMSARPRLQDWKKEYFELFF